MRIAAEHCDRIERGTSIGRPWLWRLRDTGENEAK
jgi:hypothetical protein